MTLELDLSESLAKIHRARAHLETLDREVTRLWDLDPFTLRAGEVDPDAGWWVIYIGLNELKEVNLAPVVGDLMHNLRCALDYIITALVATSGTELRNRHQFPIFLDEGHFRKKVLTHDFEPVFNGSLHGIRHGLSMIDEMQPFHLHSSPAAHPLWQLNILSNADKHRQLSQFFAFPDSGSVSIRGNGGQVVEREVFSDFTLRLNGESEMGRVRFARPFPTAVEIKGEVSGRAIFTAPPFGRYEGVGLSQRGVENVIEVVESVVTAFSRL